MFGTEMRVSRTFPKPLMLTWPANNHWYAFLAEFHQDFARAIGCSYYMDKDIVLVSNLRFEDRASGYQEFVGFDVGIVRFNERSNRNENVGQATHRVTFGWAGYNHVQGYVAEVL